MADRDALDDMLPAIYAELKRLARACLSRERANHTLQPTALVHEAYMQLIQPADALKARNRAIEIFSSLAATSGDEEARRWLSLSFKRRGALRAGPLNDLAAAERDLAQAAAIDQQRVAADPASAIAKLDLALGLSYRAVVLHRQRNLAGAATVLATAMALRSEMLRLDPQNFRVRVQLLGDYVKLAAILKDAGKPAESRDAAKHGLDLAAGVSGPAAGHPDLQAAIADLKRVS